MTRALDGVIGRTLGTTGVTYLAGWPCISLHGRSGDSMLIGKLGCVQTPITWKKDSKSYVEFANVWCDNEKKFVNGNRLIARYSDNAICTPESWLNVSSDSEIIKWWIILVLSAHQGSIWTQNCRLTSTLRLLLDAQKVFSLEIR